MIRTRFAPSPTGFMHIGGVRTALYNYLWAKHNNGKFILRIEDTDQNRFVAEAFEDITESLSWLGLNYDEGPGIKGGYGPYIQSQRLDIYKKYIEQLIKEKKAYYCFCTSDDLKKMREEQIKQKKDQTMYDRRCLKLTDGQVQEKINNKIPYVIRFKAQDEGDIIFNDEIRGEIKWDAARIDDFIILKSDQYPTYHFASVIDDHLMKINYVLRGEEWISSTPKHILLYQAFNWEAPKFVHLPVILSKEGGKLSKRHGAVSLKEFKEAGYLKEAIINFLAKLGWGYKDEEVFSLKDLIEKFDIKDIIKTGSVFNEEKLQWLNRTHFINKSDKEKREILRDFFKQKNINYDKLQIDTWIDLLIKTSQDRMKTLEDIIKMNEFIFNETIEYETEARAKFLEGEDNKEYLKILIDTIEAIDDFNNIKLIEERLMDACKTANAKPKFFFQTLRVALTGKKVSPPIVEAMVLLAKDKVINRLKHQIYNN